MTQDSDIPSISVIKKGGPAQEVASLQVMLVELQEREATREQELKRLSDVVQQLTQMSAIECILTNGFDKLSTQLTPLRDLAPKRTPLDEQTEDGEARLKSLINALKRPEWTGATSLPVPNEPVFFIGQNAPPSCTGSIAS